MQAVMEVEKNWFEDWFNSPFYHILYKDRDEAEAGKFIENLMDFLKLKKECQIIDLACGKGRHSLKLNQLGYRVTGLDLSPENIEEASKSANERLNFAVHDMRKVYANKEADLVLNLFTSFGYFANTADNLKTLNAVRKNLKYKGVLVIDFLNATKTMQHLVEEEIKVVDDISFKITRTIDQGFILKNISFTHMNKPYSFTERVQALELRDFEFLLGNAGFEIRNLFGNYQLKPFRKQDSERLIIVAQKR